VSGRWLWFGNKEARLLLLLPAPPPPEGRPGSHALDDAVEPCAPLPLALALATTLPFTDGPADIGIRRLSESYIF